MIRELREADLAEVVPLHREAFRGALGPMLGERYVRHFLRWFLAQPQAVCLVYDFAGEVAGYAFGAPDGYGAALNRELLPTVVLAALTHPHIVLHRHFAGKARGRLLGAWRRVTRGGGVGTPGMAATSSTRFSLTGIGVSPRHRKRKIGQQLLAAFEARVAAGGFASVCLDVYADNHAARRLYESMGWQLREELGRVLVYDKQLGSAT
ncbi:MAG: GNAT family N-acetyltransferase [Deltaproteobacteria bacterium]|nr:GNAT family N-acetyltransferase [Deltaproteobacteria bacterium]